jgi:hypothetical protein
MVPRIIASGIRIASTSTTTIAIFKPKRMTPLPSCGEGMLARAGETSRSRQ